jgi:hypothetical protein
MTSERTCVNTETREAKSHPLGLVYRREDATIAYRTDPTEGDETMVMSYVMNSEVPAMPDLPSGGGTKPVPEDARRAFDPGTRVEVRNRLDGAWTKGFEVVASCDNGYRLRRMSDGNELPFEFTDDNLREERRRPSSMWWY